MKRFISVILTACLVLTLSACGTQYEDTNGADDFSLQTITEENIINQDIGASGLTYREQSLGDLLFSSEYSSRNFNGVEQIYLTNFLLPSDISVYIGHMNVKQGNFKLVVVNNDEIIHEFALDTFGETFWFEDLTGSFAIRVAGESAAFDFYIDVQ